MSGLLYNSEFVCYDWSTETLWDQVEATGIVGPLTGERLKLVPITVTKWSRWRAAHPEMLALSNNTGFEEDYSADPYPMYRDSAKLWFPVARTDDRLHAKTVLHSLDFDAHSVACSHELLTTHGAYRHELNGKRVGLSLHEDGAATMDKAGERHVPVWLYWFTFHPETEFIR